MEVSKNSIDISRAKNEDIQLTGTFLEHVYNFKRIRLLPKTNSSSETVLGEHSKDSKNDAQKSPIVSLEIAKDEDIPIINDTTNDSELPLKEPVADSNQTETVKASEQAQTETVQANTVTESDQKMKDSEAAQTLEDAKHPDKVNDKEKVQEEVVKDSSNVETDALKLDAKSAQNGTDQEVVDDSSDVQTNTVKDPVDVQTKTAADSSDKIEESGDCQIQTSTINETLQPQIESVQGAVQAQNGEVKDAKQDQNGEDKDAKQVQNGEDKDATLALNGEDKDVKQAQNDAKDKDAKKALNGEDKDAKQAHNDEYKDAKTAQNGGVIHAKQDQNGEDKDANQALNGEDKDAMPALNGEDKDAMQAQNGEVKDAEKAQAQNGEDKDSELHQLDTVEAEQTKKETDKDTEQEEGTSKDLKKEKDVVVFPATVQVIGVSEEPDGNQAFSVCDGNRYSTTDAFLNLGTHVQLFSIISIILVEYEVGNIRKSKKKRKNKADGLLFRDSKFNSLLGIATFEVVENGLDIGHSLYSLQPPLIQDFEPNMDDTQNVNRMEGVTSEDQVKFVFGDQAELFADKNNLIEQSTVFERHFAVPDSFMDQHVVDIVDAVPETFSNLLKFMDRKAFQFGTLQSIFDLLYLAEKYLVKPLQTICRNAIHQHLEYIPSSSVEILSLNKTSDQTICSFVFKSIDENIQLLIQSDQFLLWDFDTLETVICLKNLNIDEWRLLCYVYKWSMDNLEEIKCGNESENCFHQLLECIKLEEISKENLNSFLNFKDLDKLINLEEAEVMIALIHLRKSIPTQCLLAPASSFRDRNFHYNASKSKRMFPVTVFSFDVQLGEAIQLPIVITGDDQTLIQIDIKLEENESEEDEGNEMELYIKVAVIGSVNGLPDTSSFRVNDYSFHPADFTADFALHYVKFQDGIPAWTSATTPFRKKWPITIDRSLMRTDMNGREVFSADLVIGSYKRSFSVSDEDEVDKNEECMNSDFSSIVPSDPESGTSLADHSANSDIFKTDSEGEPSSPRAEPIESDEGEPSSQRSGPIESDEGEPSSPRGAGPIESDSVSDTERPKTKRRRNGQQGPPKTKHRRNGQQGAPKTKRRKIAPKLGSDSGSESDHELRGSQAPDDDGSPNQEDGDDYFINDRDEENADDSFIDDNNETIESPGVASPDESDADSDIEPPKPKRRRIANQLKSDSSSESHYSTDPELGDSPTHEEFIDEEDGGNDNNDERMDSPTNLDNSQDEFSDGNPGDLCFSPEDRSDGPVMSPDNFEENEDEEEYNDGMNYEDNEEAQFSP